jgi:glycosyltransferase involved in cell wall biosynthesis
MKIAIVLNTSWNIYNFRKGLVQALLDQGHEVLAIAPRDGFSEKLSKLGCTYIPVRMDSRGANPLKDIFLIAELWHIYKKYKPDVVLQYTIKPNIYGTIAASLLRIPVINNVCGLGTIFLKDGLVSKVAMQLYKIAFRFPRKIFFQNNDDYNLFADRKLVKREICDVLPGSGINVSDFQPLQKKENQKKFTFLVVSRLIYDKGILEYINAIDTLRKNGIDARFQLLGQIDEKHKRGIPKKDIEQWIRQDMVEYLGTTEDVKQFISDADCVVLPSYREGTPKTLLEAASMAKPLIATDVPGCRNIVKNNYNGFLCKMQDANDLSEAMKRMINLSSDERNNFGLNSRTLVENEFDEKIVIDKYINSISEL